MNADKLTTVNHCQLAKLKKDFGLQKNLYTQTQALRNILFMYFSLQIRRLDTGFSPWELEFNPWCVHVTFIIDKVELEQDFIVFSLLLIISPLLHAYVSTHPGVYVILYQVAHYHILSRHVVRCKAKITFKVYLIKLLNFVRGESDMFI